VRTGLDGSFRPSLRCSMAKPDLSRRTKIVATIGPATESAEMLRRLIEAGATTFRLNFSHGDHADHALRIATIRQVAEATGHHVAILQDLQGPKIRLGRFEGGPITLATGDHFTLTSREVPCNKAIATVTYERLADEVLPGSRILLDDGRVEMVVETVDGPSHTLRGGSALQQQGGQLPRCAAFDPRPHR
jgi:pyruvate kinase